VPNAQGGQRIDVLIITAVPEEYAVSRTIPEDDTANDTGGPVRLI